MNGNASGSSIENCYTSGDINAIGGGNAGGIVGKVDGGKLVIKNVLLGIVCWLVPIKQRWDV